MVYMSVPDYTSAQWAEMAGVDVAVLGDSLAMIAHGHRSTIPATMDMMVMHGQAVRRGAPNTFLLGCMPSRHLHAPRRRQRLSTAFTYNLVRANNFNCATDHKFREIAFFCDAQHMVELKDIASVGCRLCNRGLIYL
jgi:ketopantoate hydroxymethyltransferase